MSLIIRILNVFRRRRLDDDLRQEIETHLALIEEEGRANGLTTDQADREARSRFGSPLSYRERAMDAVVATWLEHALNDLLFAARRLRRAPAFTTAAVLTLALAIGANAAIFTIVHRVVLNPLPYPDSNQVIDLDHSGLGVNLPTGIQMTPGLYFTYLDRARTLEGLALYWPNELTLTDNNGEPERLRITHVTPSLLAVLRVGPLRGLWFTDEESQIVSSSFTSPRATPTERIAVMSYRLWMRHYGGDPSLLSRSVSLEGVPTRVIGIMPPSGVMSYVVSQRTGEIGVLLALGAEPGEVARMIVRQGGIVAIAGVVIGLAVALAGSRLIESLLYDVGPRDPGVFLATTLTLLAAALIACWLPARRAAHLSPIEALRAE